MIEVEYITMACVFVGVVGLIWALLSRLVERTDASLDDRLKELTEEFSRHDSEANKSDSARTIVDRVAPKLSQALEPKDKIENFALRYLLCQAGFPQPNAIHIFLAIKLILMIMLAIIFFSFTASASWDNLELSLVAGAATGLLLPMFVLKMLARSRRDRIFLSLPNAVDLLIIALESGTAMDQAISEVAKSLRAQSPDLCQELDVYLNEMRLGGNRRKALHNLGKRAGVDALNSLANLLYQADRFGGGIARSLRDLARIMREKRRQAAEERAAKTAVKLLFPLVIFIFPGIFTILVGPAAITIVRDMLAL